MPDRYYTRRFLNRRGHHGGACVLAVVEDTRKRVAGRTSCAWTQFLVADCSRQISLEFDVCPDELANSLHKADVLIEALTKLRAALVAEGALELERRRSSGRRRRTHDDE